MNTAPHMLKFAISVLIILFAGCSDEDQSLHASRVFPEEVEIPAGIFVMGSDDGPSNEQPTHQVSVAAFFMDTTEVTVAAYQACVDAGVCRPGVSYLDGSIYCNTGQVGRDDHPINCVSFGDASTYCAWVEKRLPTEEEWEYAARGTDGRVYPWGSGLVTDEPCWSGNGEDRTSTCPIGSSRKDVSPFGVLNMSGNVIEWTASWYTVDYQSEPTDSFPVVRGGNFRATFYRTLRATWRAPDTNGSPLGTLGFRCVR